LHELGRVAIARGNLTAAVYHLREALAIVARRTERWYLVLPLASLTLIAAETGRMEVAARLAGAVAAMRQQIAVAVWRAAEPALARATALARAGLAEATFVASWAAGQAMSPAALVEAGLGIAPAASAPPASGVARVESAAARELASLTSRELEVLGLLAAGKSNQEIADALFVGRGTVRSHVSAILAKLDVKTRTEAAHLAHHHGLV
jgi:DNA-binding CsgD family transcriptional regulator